MKIAVSPGTTSKLIRFFVRDTSKTTKTGLSIAYNTSGLTCYYSKVGDTGSTSITLQTATVGTWTSGGLAPVDATNMTGLMEFGIPNACLSGGDVHIFFCGAANMEVIPIEIQTSNVPSDAYARIGANGAGLTALGDTRLSNLDATVSSRSTYAGTDTSGVTTLLSRVTASVGSPMQAGSTVILSASQPNYAPAKPADILVTPSYKLATNSDGSVNTSASGITLNNYVTVPAAVAQSSQLSGVITIQRGDTLRVSLPLMGTVSTRSKLVFTAKSSVNDPDSAAVLQVTESGGLSVLNGSSSVTASQASLTVTDATTGAVNLVILGPTTAALGVQSLVWDCQWLDSASPPNPSTPISGTVIIAADVTQAVT